MGRGIVAPVSNFTDLLLDAICMVDAEGRFVFVSAACERIFGYTQEEMVGVEMISLVDPADRERTLAAAQAVMDGQPQTHFENRYIRKDGSKVDIMWTAGWSEPDQMRVAVARDVTTIKRTEAIKSALFAISEAANASEDLGELYPRIHQIVDGLLPAPCMGIALHDEASGQLEFAYHGDNGGQVEHVQLARALCEEVLRCGQPLKFGPGLPMASFAAESADHWIGVPLGDSGVLLLHCGSGQAGKAVATSDKGYTDADRDLLVFVANQVAMAIGRKQLHARLQFLAQHDELTRLPNRRLFGDRLKTAWARAQRQQGRLSLLYIDLDKFKQVNDQYGHASGDLLLREVARRLMGCVRESDTVARIGGDEFVVLLENMVQLENAALVREKIHQVLQAPITLLGGHSAVITASIGMSHFPEHGADIGQLIRHADQAMYASKTGLAPVPSSKAG
jgi:diguanylate cyclase (GGDEF)-like protein/PAS domain S-box-containing protein